MRGIETGCKASKTIRDNLFPPLAKSKSSPYFPKVIPGRLVFKATQESHLMAVSLVAIHTKREVIAKGQYTHESCAQGVQHTLCVGIALEEEYS